MSARAPALVALGLTSAIIVGTLALAAHETIGFAIAEVLQLVGM